MIVESSDSIRLRYDCTPIWYKAIFISRPVAICLRILRGCSWNIFLCQVLYVDKDSHSYVRLDGRCRFVLRSSDKTSGVLRNPRHSLPPNTSCVYYFQVRNVNNFFPASFDCMPCLFFFIWTRNEELILFSFFFKFEIKSSLFSSSNFLFWFQGRPNEIVWVSFVKYHSAGTEPAGFDQQKDCSSQLTIWDGAAPDADLERKVRTECKINYYRKKYGLKEVKNFPKS